MPSTQPRDGPLAASAATGSSRERTRWCWPGPVRPQHAVRPTPGCRWTCRPPKAAGTGPGNGCGSRSAPSAERRPPERPGRAAQIFSGADGRRPHSPRSTGHALLAAPVVVVQPHDVILAEVVAVLHFDEDQRILAGVVDPMRPPDGNIDGLTRPDRDHLAVESDGALAGHHEPVLRPAGIPLIAEPVTGRHGDRLDLVPGAVGQHSVGTPRTHVIVDHLHIIPAWLLARSGAAQTTRRPATTASLVSSPRGPAWGGSPNCHDRAMVRPLAPGSNTLPRKQPPRARAARSSSSSRSEEHTSE